MKEYTDAHYAMMKRLEGGIVWHWHKSQGKDEILHFLDKEGLATAREDLAPGRWELTQKGMVVLNEYRKDSENFIQETHEKLQNVVDHKAEKKREHTFQVFLLFLGFVLGVIADNIIHIGEWVKALFAG